MSEKGFYKWLREGIEKGYCSDIYCSNHDLHNPGDSEEWVEYVERRPDLDFCWSVVHVRYGTNG